MFTNLRRAALVSAGALVLAASLTTSVFASPGVTVAPNAQAGNILVGDQGLTVYRYTPDQPNSSTCYDGCARAWPPVLADALPADLDATLAAGLSLAPRTDGTQQLSFKGSPLYYYVGDTQPGDITGEASDGVWFVVQVG